MATLEKIRNRAGLLILIVGLALLAFILGDFLRSGSTFFQQSKNVVLNIDGEKISAQEYQQMLQSIEQMEERFGEVDNDTKMSLNNGLASHYVGKYAMNKEAEEVGISVSPQELGGMLYGNDGRQQAALLGNFLKSLGVNSEDPKALSEFLEMISDKGIKSKPKEEQSFLYSIRAQWEVMQDRTVSDRKREKLFALVERSVVLNKIDAQYQGGIPRREVAVVRTNSSSIPEEKVKIEDTDIAKYYESHKELYKQKYPQVEMQYISSEIRPSAEDYQAAEKEMAEIYNSLEHGGNIEDALRNCSEKTITPSFLTTQELQTLRLSQDVIDFITSAQPGQVNTPELVNDKYTLIKLIDKKKSTEGVHLQIIALDSTGTKQIDSIRMQFAAGTSFAELARKYNKNGGAEPTDGYVLMPNRFGGADSVITENMAHQMQLDTIFQVPVGQIFDFNVNGVSFVGLTTKARPAVDKYKFALAYLHATFSEDTYNKTYSILNNILLNGEGKFDSMAKAAKEQGLQVVEREIIPHDAPMLGRIKSSREIIHWGLNAKAGAVNDRVFRCGQDKLVIAAVKNLYEPGYKPLEMVKDEIRTKLLVDKRSEMLAQELKAKNLSSLEGYATAMNSSIDTLSGISYLVRGAHPAELNGYAMATQLQQVSAPFAAGSEVIVVKPMSQTETSAGQTQEAALAQRRMSLKYEMSNRAYMYLMDAIKVVDNRGQFF
ncbi:hypothetical protein HQ45_03950 [Porphyromonas crevioricanis]|uniref:Peptidylprolyl isomerase n=2 Tax=Porphyromonas crevioricanis TaxID=393921 RepID=A0A0A2FNZ3_9PORP|nr:peptidylprolyl isomerase [Porphyromonas crevioricanis]KGN89984.1 hypothetical protein HQ45_03950 [Porphyromonas crevioricanis]KGN94165.1 hypothetical protein HQ38_06430 [Porphyromonas crevioricanis]SJZ67801.1 peptidyl-prolyl cis-trans isomerase D [Porphyromonas crevioricanis]SQH73981.1 peptidylprolyl isomerase [Porphyromonas crevioricanis]GAD04627.1 hypothetical protein PORCRE_317 [Porphyromonas crevioricanis JCM 15906]